MGTQGSRDRFNGNAWRFRRGVVGMAAALLAIATVVFSDDNPAAFGASASDSPKIAGRTVDEYEQDLQDEDRVVRCSAARTLGAFGEAAGLALTKALEHEDAAIRYLAAAHLGRIGGKPLSDAKKPLGELFEKDKSPAVRLAAAYALAAAGEADQPLRLMIERLASPERAMACSAAELLGQLGATASPALSALEKARDENLPGGSGDYHLGGAATEAMRKIRAALTSASP